MPNPDESALYSFCPDPDDTETEKKLHGLIGLARRAGKLTLGSAAVEKALKCGKATLVLADESISQNSAAKLKAKSCRSQTRVCVLPQRLLEKALGESCKCAAVTDESFASGILKLIRSQADH